MKWITDKPIVPGFYWYQADGRRKRIVEVALDTHHGLYILQTGMALNDMEAGVVRWAGPIPEPEA